MPSSRPMFQTCTMVFFASLSVLGFEVVLVRLCSIRYSYHYATLVISISMIGFVLGGIVAFLNQKSVPVRFLPDPLTPRTLLPFLAALVVVIPLAAAAPRFVPFDPYRLLWDNGHLFYMIALTCALAVPFFVYGTMMPLLFKTRPGLTGHIYAADLCGAAAGVLAALLLADIFPPEVAIIFLSVFPAIAVGIGVGVNRFLSLGLCLYLLGIYGAMSVAQRTLPMSPYAGLSQALKEEGSGLKKTIHTAHSRIDLFENPRMRFAPGLSLNYERPVPKGLGVAVDGRVAGVILDENALRSYDFFNHMPPALPYLLVNSSPEVVVSGNKGGIDTLMAHFFRARHIVWTDNDLSMKRLILERYGTNGPYGGAFRYESTRSYLRRVRGIDLIVVSRTTFVPSGAFGLQEDYETTVEAFQTCLSSLASDGLLYIQLFIIPPPRYELRLMNNLTRALKRMGVNNIADCLLVFRSWDTMDFLIRKSGFTANDRVLMRRFIEEMGFAQVWPASQIPAGIIGADYGRLFQGIIDEKGRAALEKSHPFDVRITTDDRPFFHYFLKVGKVGEVYRLAGNKWAYFVFEGMTLPFLAGFLFVISALAFSSVFLCSRIMRKTVAPSDRESARTVVHPLQRTVRYVFFALIGSGFMFLEAFFIHALILPLGSPVRAFAVTLVALLLGCGAGSLASGSLGRKGVGMFIAAAPVLLLSSAVCLPIARESFFLVFLAALCGLPLGVFFPCGVRLLCGSERAAIPLAYAVNGAASIIAPPLASVMASAAGLTALLVSSAGIYLAAALILGLSLLRLEDSWQVGLGWIRWAAEAGQKTPDKSPSASKSNVSAPLRS